MIFFFCKHFHFSFLDNKKQYMVILPKDQLMINVLACSGAFTSIWQSCLANKSLIRLANMDVKSRGTRDAHKHEMYKHLVP